MEVGRHRRGAVSGAVTSGFEEVAEEFRRNFDERDDLGAAFAAYQDGRLVVDIWAGFADRGSSRAWDSDTMQVIFSGTKGLVAVCILMLVERGKLDLDARVASVWPEFATAGKDQILIRDVLSHSAGLPGIIEPLKVTDALDPRRLAELLAAQQTLLSGGQLCYHPLTFGWLCSELLRRVDGRSLGEFFAQEVAVPLGLELWIGLPARFEDRVAVLELAPDWGSNEPASVQVPGLGPLAHFVERNPPLFDDGSFPWNSRVFHAAEIGGAGAIGTARSVARMYGCLARGGEIDGIRLLEEDTVRLGRSPVASGRDPLRHIPLAFGVGFELQTELEPLGPPDDAFGHLGAGGSCHGAWPTERVGFSYAMNRMRDDEAVDPRAQALLSSLYRAVT